MSDPEKTPTIPKTVQRVILIGGAIAGASVAVPLGAPGGWDNSTPELVALTAACVIAAYGLLATWEKEFSDAADVAVMTRIVELTSPAVLLGAVWMSAGLTFTDDGQRDTGRFALIVLVTVLVIAVFVVVAKLINSRAAPPGPADASEQA